MALSPGVRLGPYEIQDALGAGGMGEVYRARDTRLERTVAIKILPAQFSADPVRKQRFEREAKTISSLNHPHICVLHDIGNQDGVDYLVMECVEGETLAKRLEKGPLPLEQVLKYGAQIADALDKAHRSGIVHRDLKPGNIMLTPTGMKLLDFGLAKPAMPMTTLATLTATAPKQSPVTQEGTIVGTFEYMSPEQVEGKEVDCRSDIFSLGAVLYEMLTGRKAFQGKSQLSVASAILDKEPEPISSVKPLTPPALDHAVRRCLAKDPEERWQAARDLALELKWIAESSSQTTLTSNTPGHTLRTRWKRTVAWCVGSFILAAVATSAVWNWNRAPSLPPRTISRFTITLPPGRQLAGLDGGPVVALSPDGIRLAYVARQGAGAQLLYLRPMDGLEAQAIPGTEDAVGPFFSPDGQWLGFFAGNKLKKISVNGGPAQTLGDVPMGRGASWSDQGVIALSPTNNSSLRQMPDAGGSSQPLTRFNKGEIAHRWPDFMPGGKELLFAAAVTNFNWNHAQLAIQSLATGERRNLIPGATQPRFASSGHLIYAQGANLMAAPFDSQRLSVMGAGVPVVEGVLASTTTGAAQYSISATGSLAYVPGSVVSAQCGLVWVSRNGTEQPISAPVRAYISPRISPEGGRVAVVIREQESQIWLYDLIRGTLTRLTFEGSLSLSGVWSPEGKRLAIQSNKNGPLNIYLQPADGSSGLEQLITSDFLQFPTSWSRDGQLLAFGEINPNSGYDIWVLRLSDRKAQPFLQTPFNESVPQFSPDGHWLSYVSDESGRWEIYVQPYPGPGGKWQISTDGGMEPVWNPNGREIFYRKGDKMMAVDISTQPSFSAGKPRILFEGRYERTPATGPNYDVSPDGQRFLMLKSSEQEVAAPTQINVVLNWFEELKRRVPAEKK
ncbi:MAG: protein kinase [Candidatus Acidiferrum sp.]|jgi:serine/threonine protein kinase/Tol biopolymer transport system component